MSGGGLEETPAAAHNHSSQTASEARELQGQDRTNAALFEFQVFNMVMAALALCVLASTALYCITVCFNRNRQSKRAQAYESAVTREEPMDPVAVRAVKRSASFINPFALFRRPEADRDKSDIYYIYSNPLPIGLEEEEEREQEKKEEDDDEERGKRRKAPGGPEDQTAPSSLRKYAEDLSSGVTLDPPMFYMQL